MVVDKDKMDKMLESNIEMAKQEFPNEDKELIEFIDDAIDEAYESLTPEEVEQEFKEFEKMNKKEFPVVETEKEILFQILQELSLNRSVKIDLKNHVIDVKSAVQQRTAEELDTEKLIFSGIKALLRKVNKWYWSVLLVVGLSCFILGGLANENKEKVYPVIGKVIDYIDSYRGIKAKSDALNPID